MLDSITSAVILLLSPILFGVMSLFQSSPPVTETTKVPNSSRTQMSPSGEPAYAVSVHDDDLEDRELLTTTIYEPTTDSAIISTKSDNDLTKLERREQFLRSRLKIHEDDHEVLDHGVLHSIEAQNGFIEHIRINNSGAPIRIARGVDLDNALSGNVEYYILYRPGQIMYNDKPAISGTEIAGRKFWTQKKIDHLKEDQRSRLVKKSPKQVLDENEDQMENDIQADNIVENPEPLAAIGQYLHKDSTFSTDFFRKGFEDGSIKRIKDSAGKDILEWTKIETPYESAEDGDIKNHIYHIYDTYWKLKETIRWTKDDVRSRRDIEQQVYDSAVDVNDNESDIRDDFVAVRSTMDDEFSTEDDITFPKPDNQEAGIHLNGNYYLPPIIPATFDSNTGTIITPARFAVIDQMVSDDADLAQEESEHDQIIDNQLPIMGIPGKDAKVGDVVYKILYRPGEKMKDGKIATGDEAKYTHYWEQEDIDLELQDLEDLQAESMQSDDAIESKPLSNMNTGLHSIQRDSNIRLGIRATEAKRGDVSYETLYRSGETMDNGQIALGGETKQVVLWTTRDIEWTKNAIAKSQAQNSITIIPGEHNEPEIRKIEGVALEDARPGDVRYYELYNPGEKMDNSDIATGTEVRIPILWEEEEIDGLRQVQRMNEDDIGVNVSQIQIINPFIKEVNDIEKHTIIDTPTNEILETRYWTPRQYEYNASAHYEKLVKTNSPYTDARISVTSDQNGNRLRRIKGLDPEDAKAGDVRYYELYNHGELMNNHEVATGAEVRHIEYWKDETIQEELINIRKEELWLEEQSKKQEQDKIKKEEILSSSVELFKIDDSQIRIINPFTQEVLDMETHIMLDKVSKQVLEVKYSATQTDVYSIIDHYENLVKYSLKYDARYTDQDILLVKGTQSRIIEGIGAYNAKAGDVQYYKLYNYGENLPNGEMAIGIEIKEVVSWTDDEIARERGLSFASTQGRTTSDDMIPEDGHDGTNKIYATPIRVIDPELKEVYSIVKYIIKNLADEILETIYWTPKTNQQGVIERYEDLVRSNTEYTDTRISTMEGSTISRIIRIIQGIPLKDADYGDVWYYELYNYGQTMRNGHIATGSEVAHIKYWSDTAIERLRQEREMNALLEESKRRQEEVDDSDTSTATLLKEEEHQSDLPENNEGTNRMNSNLEAEIIESMESSQDS